MLNEPTVFQKAWKKMEKAVDPKRQCLVFDKSDHTIYTATQSFSCAVDLLQPGSRKTPGTHFEVLIGTILGAITGLARGKQISIPNQRYKVPTDIVLVRTEKDPGPVLVVPTKITTRERIVQPFVHQRILDELEKGKYRSAMVMVSEIQRSDSSPRGLNEICVPNQVGMFQRYIAQLSGLYYLDIPYAYASAEFAEVLPVRTVGQLLAEDLPKLLSKE